MKEDRFLQPHYHYYTREMRILAYSQLLESYRSLTLEYMATSFGVTQDFIDRYAILVLLMKSLCLGLKIMHFIIGSCLG